MESTGATPEREAGAPREVAPYDFRRPNRVSKDRLRTIQGIFDRLTSSFGQVFQQRLRAQVEMELSELQQMTFGEYTAQLVPPCSAFIYKLGDADESEALIDFGQHLPFHVIERLFGGAGDSFEVVRALTSTEQRAFKDQVVDRMMSYFADAWQDHIPFAPTYKDVESTPELMEVALRDDPVLVAVFRLNVHDLHTTFSFCLPIVALESFLALSGSNRVPTGSKGKAKATPEERRGIESHLRDAQALLSARLPVFRLTMEDMPRIKAGAVVHTGVHKDAALDLVAGDRAHFRGRIGRSGSIVGVRLTEAFLSAEQAVGRMPLGRVVPDPASEGAEDPVAVETPEVTTVLPVLRQLHGLALPVVVEIGRVRMDMNQLIRLAPEAALDLDRFWGEPADIYIGGRRFATGEVFQLGEHLGVRVIALHDMDAVVPLQADDLQGASSEDGAFPRLEELALPISVEVGRTWMRVCQVVRLGRGSIIELDRLTEEPWDVVVGDRRVATGEVVQMDEHFGVQISARAADVRSHGLPEIHLEPGSDIGMDGEIARVFDLALPVTVEVGRARRRISEILRLDEGVLIVLDRFAGEACDIFVGGQRFAEGEVMQMGEYFGVKITNLITPRPFGQEESL